MIELLVDNALYVISAVFFAVIGSFLFLSVKIKITDIRSRRKSYEPKPRTQARMTLYREDGTAVDMTPYIRDISIGHESPQPPEWGRRLVGTPDGAVTIEMETIVTEEDHGTSHDGGDPRAGQADQP